MLFIAAFLSHLCMQTSMNVQLELINVHTTARTPLVATHVAAGRDIGWLQTAALAMVGIDSTLAYLFSSA